MRLIHQIPLRAGNFPQISSFYKNHNSIVMCSFHILDPKISLNGSLLASIIEEISHYREESLKNIDPFTVEYWANFVLHSVNKNPTSLDEINFELKCLSVDFATEKHSF